MVHSRGSGEEVDVASGNMIVYQRPEEARLLQVTAVRITIRQRMTTHLQRRSGSLVNISCSVAGVFPRPALSILVGSVPVRPDTQYLGRCRYCRYNLRKV